MRFTKNQFYTKTEIEKNLGEYSKSEWSGRHEAYKGSDMSDIVIYAKIETQSTSGQSEVEYPNFFNTDDRTVFWYSDRMENIFSPTLSQMFHKERRTLLFYRDTPTMDKQGFWKYYGVVDRFQLLSAKHAKPAAFKLFFSDSKMDVHSLGNNEHLNEDDDTLRVDTGLMGEQFIHRLLPKILQDYSKELGIREVSSGDITWTRIFNQRDDHDFHFPRSNPQNTVIEVKSSLDTREGGFKISSNEMKLFERQIANNNNYVLINVWCLNSESPKYSVYINDMVRQKFTFQEEVFYYARRK